MKRIVLLLVILCLSFVFAGCKESSEQKENEVVMSNTYKRAREQFKAITGIEVPALEKLNVDEFPYSEGATGYCFDIVTGENLNYETFQKFETFFKEKLGDCLEGFPEGDEETGRRVEWVKDGRWYQIIWDNQNDAIYINTTLSE